MSWLDELDREFEQIQGYNIMKRTILAKCIDIHAHADLDREWTNESHGNGTNSFEASNVADDLLEIIGIDRNSEEYERLVRQRVHDLNRE